jgi:hypothetical protein
MKKLSGVLGVFVLATRLLAQSNAPVRVALLDFACDDLSYKSWEAAKTFTALLQASLPEMAGIDWVERARLEQAQTELELGLTGIMSRDTTARIGCWAGAQWALRGGFGTNQAGSRTLRLELVDLVHAELLDATNLNFPVPPGSRLEVSPGVVSQTAALLKQWLPAERARWQGWQLQPYLAILTSIGSDFQRDGMAQYLAAVNPNIHVINMGQARQAMGEADLGLIGLADASADAWRRVADFYLWYGRSLARTNGSPANASSWQIWDGDSAPVSLSGATLGPAIAEFIRTRSPAVLTHRPDPAGGDPWRRSISDALPGDLTGRKELNQRYETGELVPELWTQLVQALEAAEFLDPGNARIREAWVRVRWNSQLELDAVSQNRFRRLRSDAWAGQVERFGTNSFFKAGTDPVSVNAVMSTLDAMEYFSPSEKLKMGVPPDQPASEETRWRNKLKARLAELTLLFCDDPALAQRRVSLLFAAMHDGYGEPYKPAVRAKAIEALLSRFVKNPSYFGIFRWDAQTRSNCARVLAAAGRGAAGEHLLAEVDAADVRRRQEVSVASPAAQTNNVAIKVSLPRIGALTPAPAPSAFDARIGASTPAPALPAFDAGELDFPPPNVNARVTYIPFRAELPERICQVVEAGSALWLICESVVREASPINTTTDDIAQQGRASKGRFLWRVDLQSQTTSLWTNGLGTGEPWCVARMGDELWIGLDRGEIVSVNLNNGSTNLVRQPDIPIFARSEDGRAKLRNGLDYEGALHPAAALAVVRGNPWASTRLLSRFDAASNRWVDVMPHTPLGYELAANAFGRWLAVSPPWVLASYAQTIVANATNGAWQVFQPHWPDEVRWVTRTPPVGDGHGGFWAGVGQELVWFDTTGSNIWRTGFETPLAVRGESFRLAAPHSVISKPAADFDERELAALQRQWARRKTGALLVSRLPGLVTALAAEDDWLWVATAKGDTWRAGGYRVSLMHMPSRRWVGSIPVDERVEVICPGSNAVWLGMQTAPLPEGESPLWRIDKAPWLAVPESHWVSAELSRTEVVEGEKRLTPRQQAMRALFRGESGPFVKLYGDKDPLSLDPETLFLLAKAYDELGLNQPRRLELENLLIGQYPQNAFGFWQRQEQARRRIQEALPRRIPPESEDIEGRLDELFSRYDVDGNGELSPLEIELLNEFEPDQLAVRLMTGPSFPSPTPGQNFVMQYRRHDGNGVNREELRKALRGVTPVPRSRTARPPQTNTPNLKSP